jgi:hypothetical protein
VISAIARSLSFFCVMSFTSLSEERQNPRLRVIVHSWILINRLVLISNFRDAEPANLVLQSRALQSEPFGRSSLARNSSRRSA